MFLGDLHIHSTFSDGKQSIPEIIDLYGSRGFGVIALTDHISEEHTVIGKAAIHLGLSLTDATFPLYSEIIASESERAWKQYKMVVLKGFELSKNSISNQRSAHVLGLGIQELLMADADIPELIKAIHDQGGIAVAAHPVASGKIEKQTFHLWNRREELANQFDAWEVASGSILFQEVARTKLPKVASSDMHIAKQMRSWKTVFHCERHPQAILDAIRKQQIGFRFYEEAQNVLSTRVVLPLVSDIVPYPVWNPASPVEPAQTIDWIPRISAASDFYSQTA